MCAEGKCAVNLLTAYLVQEGIAERVVVLWKLACSYSSPSLGDMCGHYRFYLRLVRQEFPGACFQGLSGVLKIRQVQLVKAG